MVNKWIILKILLQHYKYFIIYTQDINYQNIFRIMIIDKNLYPNLQHTNKF